MNKPLRLLYCLVAPLHSDNILFLAKPGKVLAKPGKTRLANVRILNRAAGPLFLTDTRKARLAGVLLKLHLRVFHSLRLEELTASSRPPESGLPEAIVHALGFLGFIRPHNQLRGTIKSDETIRGEASDEGKYQINTMKPDPKLEALVRNQSIAIIGPAKGGDNQSEIDSFDIVVRMGYAGPDGFPEKTGSRCDVSFYAPHKIAIMLANHSLGTIDELKLAVLSERKGFVRHRINPEELPLDPNKIAWAILPPFRLTGANILIKALYNCILCQPQKIKIFNADLFLSTQYPAGYLANKRIVSRSGSWSYEHRGMCKSFTNTHNPAEQLEFYKHFFYRGAFEADPRLTEIINMPVEQYIERLDALYGSPVRQQAGLE